VNRLFRMIAALILMSCCSMSAFASQGVYPQIAGSWNVISTTTKESLCKNAVPGDVQSYIWIVSTKVDGTVSISVQGETSFPKLDGKWSVDRKTLIVEGVVDRVFGNRLFWFKLALDDSGMKLQGIRRLVSTINRVLGVADPASLTLRSRQSVNSRLAKGTSVAKSSSSVNSLQLGCAPSSDSE